MAFTFLSSTKITPLGPNGGTSAAINTTGANLIIFSAASRYLNAPTPSDSVGNNFASNRVTQLGDPGLFMQNVIWAVFNPVTNAAHTFSIDGGAGGGAASCGCITAWSGAVSLGAVADTTGFSTGTTVQPGSLTATGPGRLYITSLSTNFVGTPIIDSGFTLQEQVLYNGSANYGNSQAYIIQGAAAALNPTWTDVGTSSELISTMAIFEPAAAASPFNRGYVTG